MCCTRLHNDAINTVGVHAKELAAGHGENATRKPMTVVIMPNSDLICELKPSFFQILNLGLIGIWKAASCLKPTGREGCVGLRRENLDVRNPKF